MKTLLEALNDEYKEKFAALLIVAEMFEKEDELIFKELLKKAAGCKLMIKEYEAELSKLNTGEKGRVSDSEQRRSASD